MIIVLDFRSSWAIVVCRECRKAEINCVCSVSIEVRVEYNNGQD
jgi:hypothetical protein